MNNYAIAPCGHVFKTKCYFLSQDLCTVKRIPHETGKNGGFQNCLPLILQQPISHLANHKRTPSWHKWLVSCWSSHCNLSSFVPLHIITPQSQDRQRICFGNSLKVEVKVVQAFPCSLYLVILFPLSTMAICLHSCHYFSYHFRVSISAFIHITCNKNLCIFFFFTVTEHFF